MKASIDKLRWGLAGGSLLLLLALVAVVAYGRYQAARLWKNRLNKLGVHIEQTTNDVTYSQTIQGHTVFTLRAGKAVQRKDGKTTLHNVQLTLYGKKDGSEDRIYGSEFEYDEKAGVARALGEVEMDLRAPGSLSKGAGASGTAQGSDRQEGGGDTIHVRTSGLTYVRKLGVAATDQQVLFRYAGLQCTARGAEFNAGESIVHLLADVTVQGELHGKPVQLHAGKADLDHAASTISLASPTLQSGMETASAHSAELHLRHDGSVAVAEAEGNVLLREGTRQITAAHLSGRFREQNVPQAASFTGGVRLVDTNTTRPMRGYANRADGVFDPAGAPMKWVARGGARLESAAKTSAGQVLSRSLEGEEIEAVFKPGSGKASSTLTTLHVTGSAKAGGDASAASGMKATKLSADDLQAQFAESKRAGSPLLQQVIGTGHTRLQQNSPDGAEQISSADKLEVHVAPSTKGDGELQIVSAIQDGHVQITSLTGARPTAQKRVEPLSARASHSFYEGASGKLVLTGNAQFVQGSTAVTSDTLTFDERSGDSDAVGSVLATLSSAEPHESADATHIRANRAHLDKENQRSVFFGTDADPARLWQGASQVEAATLSMDGKNHTVKARLGSSDGAVHSIFASSSKQAKNARESSGPDARVSQVERVSAGSLDYDDALHVATYAGGVTAQGDTGQVRAQHAQLFFAPSAIAAKQADGNRAAAFSGSPSMGGSLQRAVLWGNVQLSQTGRTGQGDKLVYTASDATFLLTGTPTKPAQVVDHEHGSVTGGALLFHSGDNKVVVTSSNAAADGRSRVHTETGAKQ